MDTYPTNHPSAKHNRPEALSSNELRLFNEVALNLSKEDGEENSNPWFTLASSRPGDSFLLNTMMGEVIFSIQRLPHQENISENEAVFVSTYETNRLMKFSQFLLYGASESLVTTRDSIGIIRQYSDLVYAPARMEPLLEYDHSIDADVLQQKIQSGELVQTQMGVMRLITDKPAALPAVLDLAHIDNSGDINYIFRHVD